MRYQLNKTKYLLEPEIESLEKVLTKFRDSDPRDTLMIELALATGARASELLGIEKHHLNSDDGSVFIKGLKGSDDREIPLKKPLYERLLKFSETQESLLFPISYQRLGKIWGVYRPVVKKFHSLRHTFAIQLYKKTRDLRLVQVALGHRNIQNTMIYAEYVYNTEELRRLIHE